MGVITAPFVANVDGLAWTPLM